MSSKTKPSRWGSLLSGAVAGIESRLDTILADEKDASAKSRAAEQAAREAASSANGDANATLAVPRLSSDSAGRSSSLGPSEWPSTPNSEPDAIDNAASTTASRSSLDGGKVKIVSLGLNGNDDVIPTTERAGYESSETLLTSALPINPGFHQALSVPEITIVPDRNLSIEALEVNLAQVRADHVAAEQQYQEEIHAHLERIDALQAKLQYLSKETIAAAKEANAPSSSLETHEKKLAAKDERIALLMEEGENLSKKEMRNLATIKLLNVRLRQDDTEITDLRRKITALEQSDSNLREKVQRLEQMEKQNALRRRQSEKLETDLQSLRSELDLSNTIAASLRQALSEADQKSKKFQLDHADAMANSSEIAAYKEKLRDMETAMNHVRATAQSDLKRVRDDSDARKAQAHNLELELRTEISTLETRMEGLRFKAEEASSDTAGDAQAKLLRQVETLQTQYSLAAENWRTIEGSLNGRIATLEVERNDATRREAEVRKKQRDVVHKSRQLEEELERSSDTLQAARKDLTRHQEQQQQLSARIKEVEEAMVEAKADFDRQRQVLEVEASTRLEEERRRNSSSFGLYHRQRHPSQTHSRKASIKEAGTLLQQPQAVRNPLSRLMSNDSSGSLTPDRIASQRPAMVSPPSSYWRHDSIPSRPNSRLSFNNLTQNAAGQVPPTPPSGTEPGLDGLEDDMLTSGGGGGGEYDDSPRQGTTINDVMSASTVHAGPSVQLVERMSSSIRRLEAEKAAHKDEVARLAAQRDEARDQMVAYMRELEEARRVNVKSSDSNDGKRGPLAQPTDTATGPTGSAETSADKDLQVLRKRYDACLEMLGEREEECAELKADVSDLKRIYRELAAQMGRS